MFRSARYIFVLLLVLAACAGSLIFCTDLEKMASETGKYTPIFSGKQFTENELIQIELAFADAKLSDYVISNGTVQVPKRQKTIFLQALKKMDFLTQEAVELQSSSGGLFVSEKEREAASLRDKQAALAAQIRSFHGIESARVLLDVSETKVGFTREKHASAAVSIRSRTGYSVTQEDIQSILRLVTCSVCGLKPANVTIVDTRTNQSWHFDSPKIEVVPENTSSAENQASGSTSVGPNQAHKIVFQSAQLPPPELFDSVPREILQTSAETPISNSNSSVTQSKPLGQITFGGSSEPETLPELALSNEIQTNLFNQNTNQENVVGGPSSSQHPREIKILFGVFAAPIILICIWIIYVTRKGFFNTESKDFHEISFSETHSEPVLQSIPQVPVQSNAQPIPQPVSVSKQELLAQIVTEISSEAEMEPELEPESLLENEPEIEVEPESEPEPPTASLPKRASSSANLPETSSENGFQCTTLPELATLEQVAPNRLALAFLEERPQTAAMLLVQFHPEKAREILTFIPVKLRLGIESRMVGCQAPDAEILREAARAILEHLDELAETQPQLDDLRNDLKSFEDHSADLPPQRPAFRPLAEAIPKERILRFEDLKSCTDGELRGILRETSVQDVNLALFGAEPELVNRVLDVLPKPAAKELQFQLTHPGKIRLMEVEEARQRMVEHAGV